MSCKKVITAKKLAEKLAVAERTIYRDIQDLMLSDVPIISETGIGYRLMEGYRIPPLMFSADEVTALLMGAKFVQASADSALAHAAQEAINKISRVIPQQLNKVIQKEDFYALDFRNGEQTKESFYQIRTAINQLKILSIKYQDEKLLKTQRQIRPLGIFYWGKVWTVVAWCELRNDFRQFRIDRIQHIEYRGKKFNPEANKQLTDYLGKYHHNPDCSYLTSQQPKKT
ncbi:MAG: YafY family transcriptional regulator [Proteobacteria bacterium]|nr:YafY family transcriptional regulator [Pseudomonadota bacterium]